MYGSENRHLEFFLRFERGEFINRRGISGVL